MESEWISVEDRLPDVNDEYIIYFTDKRGSFVTGDAFWVNDHFETLTSTHDNHSIYGVDTDEKITHWRPLPEPPKQIKL